MLGTVMRLWAGGVCGSVDEGIARAREAISSGVAAASLERVLESCA